MFGYITPNLDKLSQKEKDRYTSLYCGLCHSLRDNYNQVSRLALSYDLTFLLMLLSSLYEPQEKAHPCNCIFHPGKKYQTINNCFSDYCASLTVVLAYHKILDDVNDEGKLSAKIGQKALQKQYEKAKNNIPEMCDTIEIFMQKISDTEKQAERSSEIKGIESGDKISQYFGMIMAKIFAIKDDFFNENLAKFGANLGRFIYFMDAACDLKDDISSGSYNPYKFYYKNFDNTTLNNDEITKIKKDLSILAGKACHYFEKLPIVKDEKILQNILYEGCWLRFNQTYKKVSLKN